MEVNKRKYLLENGWWAHYHDNCWFESSKDELYVKLGRIVGFKPQSEGITLEKAYEKARI
tara:strand:+ start:1326 stop:1505 length:180 start_codon:yes stop_codon:yes gene_type:complete